MNQKVNTQFSTPEIQKQKIGRSMWPLERLLQYGKTKR